MSGRICFVANYSKTWLFDAVAEQLTGEGVAVSWITVNRVIADRLQDAWGTQSVLYLPLSLEESLAEPLVECKLNELVYGDRALRHIPQQGLNYLRAIQMPLCEFLKNHRPSHIISELTWAHELLLERMARLLPEMGMHFIRPEVVRIPNGRFAFFVGGDSSRIVEFTQTEKEPQRASRSAVTLVRRGETASDAVSEETGTISRPERPSYLSINDRIRANENSFVGRLRKVKRFFSRENITPDDPTLIQNDWLRLRLRLREEWNRERYRFITREPLPSVTGQPFVFMTLHKQPEASIDVLGRYVEDQLVNIINVWRTLPSGWQIVVKEHTNAIGDRPPTFYANLLRIPGIRLVHEKTDSHELIRRCEVVVTVSGTVAFEAALMGKPALTFAPMYFNALPGCAHISLEHLRACSDLRELIPSPAGDRAKFQAHLLANSFEGEVLDPITSPRVLEPENIRRVARAMVTLLGTAEDRTDRAVKTKAAQVERPKYSEESEVR